MVRAMTTLKPQLVRADTLDLQDHDAPSAKDHTRQPAHPSPYGYGPAAPHQAQTLRHAEEEAYQQQKRSPGVSEDHNRGGPFSDSQRFFDDDEDEVDDEHMNHLHGANGTNSNGRDYEEDGDASDSHDEDMDDDLMDKISSSPSIEDGKYSLPQWPPRLDSVDVTASPASSSTPTRGISFPSPFLSPPVYFPIPRQEMVQGSESRLGEEAIEKHPVEMDSLINLRNIYSLSYSATHTQYKTSTLASHREPDAMDMEDLTKYLLPIDDPLLDDSLDDRFDEGFYDDEDAWEDEAVNIPEYQSSSEDETDFLFSEDSRFIDSGWGGECLRELEDIDFEFVYALHTFVATVEGQANATKGDTMVLLDDSNSYWWLVRVVKDGSIGYLPAEHIETPTERLARLNKHRNIDLSASMLGDNPEKSKNPLKKAMRRRNAKTVQFTAPTYYEPSEYDYSDEEEDGDGNQLDPVDDGTKAQQTDQAQNQEIDETEVATREARGPATTNGIIQRVASNESLSEEPSSPVKAQAPEPLQPGITHQDSMSRSRKGNVRNTDSFFKDDTAETKKISLTPRLLRGDSDSNGSAEPELRQRPSLETFDKMLGSEEKPKEDKKKEKKGMLSGLFKRKEKPPKGSKVESDPQTNKISEESMRHSPQSKDSLESLTKPEPAPERKPSKLQKHPPSYTSPKSSPTEPRAPQPPFQTQSQTAAPPAPTGPAPAPPTLRQVDPIDTSVGREEQKPIQHAQDQPQSQTPNRFPSLQEKRSIFSPISAALRSAPTPVATEKEPNVKPVHSKRAKERFAIDTSDSEEEPLASAPSNAEENRGVSPLTDNQTTHRRNDSGMQISPVEPSEDNTIGGRGGSGTDGKQQQEALKASTPPQNVEVTPIDETEHTASTSKPSPSTATTHTPSTSRSTPTWSDASLRTYMENDQDIKDLLIIVHDKSNVTPVGPDHPLMTNLFSNERTKLAEMQANLDTMLMSWMSRKNASLLSR